MLLYSTLRLLYGHQDRLGLSSTCHLYLYLHQVYGRVFRLVACFRFPRVRGKSAEPQISRAVYVVKEITNICIC